MKQVIFLIVTLIVFRPVVPVMDYLIDYEYISTVLCINKDKPELECNGKCFLMQELAKVADEQQHESTKKLCAISFSILFYCQNTQFEFIDTTAVYLVLVADSYQELVLQDFINTDFKPPLVV